MLCESPKSTTPYPTAGKIYGACDYTIGRVVVSATPILNDRIIRCQEANVIRL